MSGKVARQIRKTVNSQELLAITKVLDFIEKTAKSKNFFQRWHIAMRYVFKKDFDAIMGE
jgi:hypothetical protein